MNRQQLHLKAAQCCASIELIDEIINSANHNAALLHKEDHINQLTEQRLIEVKEYSDIMCELTLFMNPVT